MAIAGQMLTLDEFLRLPEQKPALEYCAGAVRQKVVPETQHSLLQWLLCDWINDFALPHKLAMALAEWRMTFAGASHVSDVAVCEWARIPRDRRGRPWGPLTEPPLVAVEIASPGQSLTTLADDCAWYVAHGVQLALLINPQHETSTAYRPDTPPQRLHGPDRLDFGPALPGFSFVVLDLFDAAGLA
jgi:Uma2 family endonuclease